MSRSSRYTDSIRSQTTCTDISSKSDAEARYYRKERRAERRRRKAETMEHVSPPSSCYAATTMTRCTADQQSEGTESWRVSINESDEALPGPVTHLQNSETQRYAKVHSTETDQIHNGPKDHGLETSRPLQALTHGSTKHVKAPETMKPSRLETNNPTQHSHAQPPINLPNRGVIVGTTDRHMYIVEDPKASASVQGSPPAFIDHRATRDQIRSVHVVHDSQGKPSLNDHLTSIAWDSFYNALILALESITMALKFFWYPVRILLTNKFVLGLIIASFIAHSLIPSKATTLFCSGLGVAANLCLPARQVHKQLCVAPDKSVNYFPGVPRVDILDELNKSSTSHLRFLENNFAHFHRSVKDFPRAYGPESQAIILAETYANTYSQAIDSAERLEDELRQQQLSLYYKVDGYIGRFPSKTVERSFLDRVFGRANSVLRYEARRATDELLAVLQTSWKVYNTVDENTPTDAWDGPLHDLFRIDIHKLCEELQSNMNRAASDAENMVAANARVWTLNSDVIMRQIRNKARIIKRELQWLDLQMQILERNRQTLKQGQRTLSVQDWEGLLNDIMVVTIKMAIDWRGKVKAVLAAK